MKTPQTGVRGVVCLKNQNDKTQNIVKQTFKLFNMKRFELGSGPKIIVELDQNGNPVIVKVNTTLTKGQLTKKITNNHTNKN